MCLLIMYELPLILQSSGATTWKYVSQCEWNNSWVSHLERRENGGAEPLWSLDQRVWIKGVVSSVFRML